MNTLIVSPDNEEDVQLLIQLLQRLEIRVRLLTPEQEEELGLTRLLDEIGSESAVPTNLPS